jgi:hypothetical protein
MSDYKLFQHYLEVLKSFGRYEEDDDFDWKTGESLRDDFVYREPENEKELSIFNEASDYVNLYLKNNKDTVLTGSFLFRFDMK